jgi:flagellar hook-associated protein FlgK
VAAGQIDATGAHAVGDNRNALALAALEEALVGPDGLTFAEAYQRLATKLGLDGKDAGNQKIFSRVWWISSPRCGMGFREYLWTRD